MTRADAKTIDDTLAVLGGLVQQLAHLGVSAGEVAAHVATAHARVPTPRVDDDRPPEILRALEAAHHEAMFLLGGGHDVTLRAVIGPQQAMDYQAFMARQRHYDPRGLADGGLWFRDVRLFPVRDARCSFLEVTRASPMSLDMRRILGDTPVQTLLTIPLPTDPAGTR